MSVLQKDYQDVFTPGSLGSPGSPGSPAVPGYFYTYTERHSIFTPIYPTQVAENLRFATHDELRMANLWPVTMDDCTMQKRILTFIMTRPKYNTPLFWFTSLTCLILASVPNIISTFGLYVLTTNVPHNVPPPYGIEQVNPMYDKSHPYIYHGEIPGCP